MLITRPLLYWPSSQGVVLTASPLTVHSVPMLSTTAPLPRLIIIRRSSLVAVLLAMPMPMVRRSMSMRQIVPTSSLWQVVWRNLAVWVLVCHWPSTFLFATHRPLSVMKRDKKSLQEPLPLLGTLSFLQIMVGLSVVFLSQEQLFQREQPRGLMARIVILR